MANEGERDFDPDGGRGTTGGDPGPFDSREADNRRRLLDSDDVLPLRLTDSRLLLLLNGAFVLLFAFDGSSREADEADDEQLDDRDELSIELIDGTFFRDAFRKIAGICGVLIAVLFGLVLFSDANELRLDVLGVVPRSGGPGLADDPPDDFLACRFARLCDSRNSSCRFLNSFAC